MVGFPLATVCRNGLCRGCVPALLGTRFTLHIAVLLCRMGVICAYFVSQRKIKVTKLDLYHGCLPPLLRNTERDLSHRTPGVERSKETPSVPAPGSAVAAS